MAIPIAYNLRNLVVRKTSTLMTALGIALTVAILLAVLALVNGLRTTLEALVEQAGQRVKATCTMACPEELPELDGSVDLHIFRILQESLNNVARHAQATEIALTVHADRGGLTFTLTDNGKGLESTGSVKKAAHGGMGMTGMQERMGIIRSYYPATLTVRSQPDRGTITTLTIQLPSEP